MSVATTKLRRVVELTAGGTPAVDDPRLWADADADDATPWVSISDMPDGAVVRTTQRRVTAEGLRDRRLQVAPPGTLLFAMYASVGAVAELGVPAVWNQALLGLRPLAELADRRFLRYWLLHLRPSMSGLVRSNTQDNLNAEQVGNFPFPLLSVDRQQVIANFLDTETARIDALIAKKLRMTRLLRGRVVALRQRELESLSSTGGTVPLRRLVTCLDGRRVPLNREERASRTGPFPYWGAGGVVDSIDDYLFDEQLVLLGEDGAPFFDETRDVSYVVAGRVWVNNHIHVLRPSRRVHAEWLCHMLNAVDYSSWITGSTRDKLTQEEMMQIRVPNVSLQAQAASAAELGQLSQITDEAASLLTRQIALLHEHRQALITAAVTGELDVPGAAA